MILRVLTLSAMVLTASLTVQAQVGIWPAATPTSDLEFAIVESTLVASLSVRVNNCPAVVITSHDVDHKSKTLDLHFFVVQNYDLWVRSLRWCRVEWQLPLRYREEYEVSVRGGTGAVTTEQLEILLRAEPQEVGSD